MYSINDLILFLEKENMYSDEFIDYLEKNKLELPSKTDKHFFGCFAITDKNNIINGLKLCVPRIETLDDLLVNIHEYTHAYMLFNMLNKEYIIDKDSFENKARNNEKKYIKRLKNNRFD